MSALLTQSPGDTVQTGTGKVDPARKLKCTKAAREIDEKMCKEKELDIFKEVNRKGRK